MNRLFFALWPDDITRQRCAGIINSIGTHSSQPISAGNLHVTLTFLGNVPSESLEPLIQQASQVYVPAVKIRFNRLSFWKKPGILCLTSSTTSANLVQLVNDLNTIAKAFNIKLDTRPYKPHITLMRNANTLSAVEFEPVIWRSHAFCLVKSHTGLHGVEYEVIKDWRGND